MGRGGGQEGRATAPEAMKEEAGSVQWSSSSPGGSISTVSIPAYVSMLSSDILLRTANPESKPVGVRAWGTYQCAGCPLTYCTTP